jgi:TatA/E family protein of Tat protein translocase
MLSLPHLVVLFVIALIIFGPQKLPELARMLGKATAEFRKMSSDFRYALENEVSEMERQTRIREAEVASALTPVLPISSQPEGTLSREVPSPEPTAQAEPARAEPVHAQPVQGERSEGEPVKTEPVQAEGNPAQHPDVDPNRITADAVTTPHEKPSDDTTAV